MYLTIMSQKQYPQYVIDRINAMSQKFNIGTETLFKEFDEYYNEDFVQKDPQFKSDDDRYKYVLEVLWVRYSSQPPTEDFLVIPFGITDIRIAQKVAMSRIYALVRKKGEQNFSLGVIVNRGSQALLVDDVQLFYAYEVKLSKFTKEGNVFFSTSTTKFQDPKPLPKDPLELLHKLVGIVDVKIVETPYKLSKTIDDDRKFVDEFDLRGVSGIVLRYNTGKRPSGTDWAVYTIADDSVGEEKITPEGVIIPSQFTVWIPRRFLRFDVDSKIYCVGTIQLSSNKEPFMNAIYVHPIYAKPLNL
jgi:hypothetical protein